MQRYRGVKDRSQKRSRKNVMLNGVRKVWGQRGPNLLIMKEKDWLGTKTMRKMGDGRKEANFSIEQIKGQRAHS